MIQRIQSVYLLLATALLVTTIFLPVGYFLDSNGLLYFFSPLHASIPSVGLSFTPWGQLALLILGALVSFATIFLFKNRKLQVRMCVFNILILIGYYVVFLVFMILIKEKTHTSFQFSFGLCLPFIAMILNYLAIRGVRKDEQKIRAADRIR